MPPPAPHRAPIPTRAIAASLTLGCLTTILSAWAICLFTSSPTPAAGAGTIVHDPAGAKVVFSGRSLARAELLWHPDDGFRTDPPEPDIRWNHTPSWARRAIRTTPPNTIYLAAGWPALAMHMTVRDTDPAVLKASYEARGGLFLEYRANGRRRALTLPLTPHWPAFALNTALFSAWWALGLSFLPARHPAPQSSASLDRAAAPSNA